MKPWFSMVFGIKLARDWPDVFRALPERRRAYRNFLHRDCAEERGLNSEAVWLTSPSRRLQASVASILAGVALGGALIALHTRREPHS
jgi:hypothetical protein